MYTLEDMVRELREATATGQLAAIKEAVARAITYPPLAADPSRPAILCDEPGLMVLHTAVDAGFKSPPHEHRTWAVIGVYQGQEDNTFYRLANEQRAIEEAGGRSLKEGEVLTLGDEVIHKIANPRAEKLVALHVYGVNILTNERSAWDPMSGKEYPFGVKIGSDGRFDNQRK